LNQWVFHSAKINAISWSLDSKFVVSGSLDTNIEIWSVDQPMKHQCIKGAHLESVNAVSFLTEKKIVSAGQDGCIKVNSKMGSLSDLESLLKPGFWNLALLN
jgi:WD40 repeat protein